MTKYAASLLLVCFIFAFNGPAAEAPNAKIQQEYDRLLTQADLKKYPERHAQMARWCANKHWPEQAAYHERENNRHIFEKQQKESKGSAVDFQRLATLAKRMNLQDEEANMLERWRQTEYKERRAKIKAGDVDGLKKLLAWADQEGVGACEQLAAEILELDPDNELAHRRLNHLKDGEVWVDPWALLVKRGGLKDVKVRYQIHRQLETAHEKEGRSYPRDPYVGLKKIIPDGYKKPVVWRNPLSGYRDGKGQCFIWAPDTYTPANALGLIVDLHGGGTGGVQAGVDSASNWLGYFATRHADQPYVIVTPVVRNHVINSWNVQDNLLDVMDAIIDACKRFHIDRKRIYLTGASMGGQGTQRMSWVVPELFAAFVPRAGAYWNDYPVPDLTGKFYLVFHGAKDADFRNKTVPPFLEKLKRANANVEYINLPEAGHNLPDQTVVPAMFAFFKKHANDFAPDLSLVRRTIVETVKEKPYGQK